MSAHQSVRLARAMAIGLALGHAIFSSSAHAVTSYTALDLGVASVRGLNDSGQVIGFVPLQGGDARAFYTGANGQGIYFLNTPDGTGSAFASDINNAGQVVGFYTDVNNNSNTRGFITAPNSQTVQDFHTPGSSFSAVRGVNDQGQVLFENNAGTFISKTDGSEVKAVFSPGWGGGGHFLAINNSGQVTGTASNPPRMSQPNAAILSFITDANGANIRDLGTLGGSETMATAITDVGRVIGLSKPAGEWTSHAFLTGPNGVGMKDLGTLGGQISAAYGINSLGQVVGVSSLASDPLSADDPFVTDANGENMRNLKDLVALNNGDTLVRALGINESGQIIVESKLNHSYLLTPVPEASTIAMFLTGLGILVAFRRRNTL